VREEKENYFIKEQTHQQNVKKIIEFQMKKNVKQILNNEQTQNLRDVNVKNL
jgi:ABC-type Fe3+ transport system substrate-binding protein